jgi:hypothetical protein
MFLGFVLWFFVLVFWSRLFFVCVMVDSPSIWMLIEWRRLRGGWLMVLLYGLLGVSGVKEKERVCWVLKGCFFGF